MSWLKEKLQSEPVRLYLYGLLAPLLALLVSYGVVESEAVPVLVALGGAILGLPATELARAKVASPKTQKELRSEPPR